MAKKFDKISPKNISEAKFNQLIDALPSSAIEPSKKLTSEPEEKRAPEQVTIHLRATGNVGILKRKKVKFSQK